MPGILTVPKRKKTSIYLTEEELDAIERYRVSEQAKRPYRPLSQTVAMQELLVEALMQKGLLPPYNRGDDVD